MKRIGILYHPLNKAAFSLAQKLVDALDASGVSSWLCSAWEIKQVREQLPLSADEAIEKLPGILSGEGWIEQRAMLKAELTGAGEEPGLTREFLALNDVVIARGEIARIIYVQASVNGQPVTTYNADGVIMATATGSTGYSLAAGGPILHPQAEEWLLVPILPHLSLGYSLVMPPDAVVKLKLGTTHQATLSIDGHISLPLESGATITVTRSREKIRFLRIRPRDYFYSSLEQKLKG
jgi:NAD+ kinase